MKIQVTLLALLALGACSKDKDGASEGTKAAKGAEPAAAAAKAGPLALAEFGLTIDAPAGTETSKLGDSVMLQGPGLVVTVDVAGEFSPKTLAEEVEESDMYTPKNIVKAEVEGGWDMTFENTGGAGTNYWVKVRRTIDGKSYNCSTTSSSTEQQAAALAACKTLKK